jgi:hypothetical protein
VRESLRITVRHRRDDLPLQRTSKLVLQVVETVCASWREICSTVALMRFAVLVARATSSVPRNQFLQQKASSMTFCGYQKRIAFSCDGLNTILHFACWCSGYRTGNSSENVLCLCIGRQPAASEIFIVIDCAGGVAIKLIEAVRCRAEIANRPFHVGQRVRLTDEDDNFSS